MKDTGVFAALRRPMSTRLRMRWSTAVMAILFLGLGALWLEVKTGASSSSASNTAKAVNDVGKGLAPGESITITHNGTTTTTVPTTTAPTTTTVPPPASTAPPSSPGSTVTTVPTRPSDTVPSTTAGTHQSPTTSSSVPGVHEGSSTTTVSPST